MIDRSLSDLEADRFWRDGFLVLERFFDEEIIRALRAVASSDPAFQRKIRTGLDYQGNEVRLWITSALDEGLFSALVRSRRIVETAERLLAGEVYHWHHKMILKAARVGGAWEWHQDYGYWYDYGCLFPDLVSCMVAIDPATADNGCLQVVRGSHKMGRLDTSRAEDQTGVADPRRIESIRERMETFSCELSPGDAVFFHANTLHRSDANSADEPRWAFISVYNSAANEPQKITPIHAHDEDAPPTPYEPLERWSVDRIREIAARETNRLSLVSPE